MQYTKDSYAKLMKLYAKQKWLLEKSTSLEELIKFCGEETDLIFSLLEKFTNLDDTILNLYLQEISNHIINDSGFIESTSQIVAMTFNEEADSGQKTLDQIKIPLFKNGWKNLKTVNTIGKCTKQYKEGKTQIIIIDEFIGSGKTVKTQVAWIKKNVSGPVEILCCFIAGIKESIELLTSEGINIFCPLQLDKGISGHYKDEALIDAKQIMFFLESKLAATINGKNLSDYTFGYGEAEALLSMQGCNGNTPNSVFPIFWWLQDENYKERHTLLTRYEIGF